MKSVSKIDEVRVANPNAAVVGCAGVCVLDLPADKPDLPSFVKKQVAHVDGKRP